jgi:flagellar biosynthetic protein FlhB
MAEDTGDKTEHATPKKLEQAYNRGQFAKSAEIQTVFVLLAAMTALKFCGPETWRLMAQTQVSVFSHLHDTPLTLNAMQGYSANAAMVLLHCVWPVLSATVLAGLLAGGIQTRFRTSPEALDINWARLNPVEGFKRTFSMKAVVPTGISIMKLSIIGGLTYGVIKDVVGDPIFHSSVDLVKIAAFMADSAFKIVTRVGMALVVLASADYGYQYWQAGKDLMMTKEEVKEEMKNSDGNPQVKMAQKRKRRAMSKRKMLAEVPKADVVLVNPTHIAVALRYDRKTMKAPTIVAKGIRMNAQKIREIAEAHQVPVVQNISLARLMFKYGRVGGEIPAKCWRGCIASTPIVTTVNKILN